MYYLWLNEAQAGPYTLQQVQSLWNEGKITALTLFWQEGKADWQPLSEIQSTIEPSIPAALLEKTAVMPPYQQIVARKAQEKAAASVSVEPRDEKVEWSGCPTWWKWGWLLLVAVALCLLPIGLIAFLALSILISLASVPVALLIFGYVYLARGSTQYMVTNKRISVESGIFNKTSRELRIQDIRSIAAHINFLGYGDIEFSSAASDEVDVVFTAVSGAAKVRDLVKKLQA